MGVETWTIWTPARKEDDHLRLQAERREQTCQHGERGLCLSNRNHAPAARPSVLLAQNHPTDSHHPTARKPPLPMQSPPRLAGGSVLGQGCGTRGRQRVASGRTHVRSSARRQGAAHGAAWRGAGGHLQLLTSFAGSSRVRGKDPPYKCVFAPAAWPILEQAAAPTSGNPPEPLCCPRFHPVER
jgi:hypothetical protein